MSRRAPPPPQAAAPVASLPFLGNLRDQPRENLPHEIGIYLNTLTSNELRRLGYAITEDDIIYDVVGQLQENTNLAKRQEQLRQWEQQKQDGTLIDVGSYGVFEYVDLPSYDGDSAIKLLRFLGLVDMRTFKRFQSGPGTGEIKEFTRMVAPRDGAYGETYKRSSKDAAWKVVGREKEKRLYSRFLLFDISAILRETYRPEDNSVIFFRDGGILLGGNVPEQLIPLLGGPL